MTEMLSVKVWRGRGGNGQAGGGFTTYDVPRAPRARPCSTSSRTSSASSIRRSRYRFACRVGMCGSCAMTVNGMARWTCRTHVATVAARTASSRSRRSRNLPVIRDLVTDMREFFDKWARREGPVQWRRDAPRRLRAASRRDRPSAARGRRGIECIGCGVCYASCDVVTWRPRLPRSRRAQSRVDARQRRARRRSSASACGGGGRRGLPRLPHAGLVHRALPEAARADGRRSPD